MLTIVNYNQDEYDFPALIVLGCFDALHAGHAELIKKAKLQAKINGLDLGVMMFTEGKGGKQVYTFEERLKLLEAFNVKFVLKIDFTEEFKKTPAAEFLKNIEDKINVKGYMSGKDFRFGAGAKGKSSTLKSYADDEENGVWYTAVKDVMFGDDKISTKLIKGMLEEGDTITANELLARTYSVSGKVVKGAGRGEKLGFPTMNVEYPEEKVRVKEGVYIVNCTIDGKEYRGIGNFGSRPTFGENEPALEVHLLDYSGSNYGEEVSVGFVEYLRDIKKFANESELKAQLTADLSKVKR